MCHHTIIALTLLAALSAALPIDVTQNSSSTLPPTNDAVKALTNSTKEKTSSKPHKWLVMEDPNLFEGDLEISQEMIDKYYHEKNETRSIRAAVQGTNLLWPNGRVYYRFDSTVSSGLLSNIFTAMATIERQTCIRFYLRSSQSDYIYFRSYSTDGCSSSVGRRGGSQDIKLGPGCNNAGIILHEIGHALGLWHEQSRPDRDDYVRILNNNIVSSERHNFNKRSASEVDYRGTTYDYGSVMHYRRDAFAVSSASVTIEVTNNAEYTRQGSPTLGPDTKTQLSSIDATQLKRMYDCSDCPSGYAGTRCEHIQARLRVYARYGSGLPDRDSWFAGNSDPYVRVIAYDHEGNSRSLRTDDDSGDHSPEWYEWLDFGFDTWKRFTVQVFDEDIGSDDSLSSVSTYTLTQLISRYNVRKNCNSGYIYFDYVFVGDGNDCSPNPCVRGTCSDLYKSYRCNCPSGYAGTNCEHIRERLRVYARYGSGLPDRDGWFAGRSDPYVRVIAYDHEGNSRSLRTDDDSGDQSPEWNEWLDFKFDTWKRFTVQVFDEDFGSDDSLSSVSTYTLTQLISRTNVRKNCDSGYIYFDYQFGS